MNHLYNVWKTDLAARGKVSRTSCPRLRPAVGLQVNICIDFYSLEWSIRNKLDVFRPWAQPSVQVGIQTPLWSHALLSRVNEFSAVARNKKLVNQNKPSRERHLLAKSRDKRHTALLFLGAPWVDELNKERNENNIDTLHANLQKLQIEW